MAPPCKPQQAPQWAAEAPSESSSYVARFQYFADSVLVPAALVLFAPPTTLLLAFITASSPSTMSHFAARCSTEGLSIVGTMIDAVMPTKEACAILLVFNLLALIFYAWPGPTAYGPVTANGVRPAYTDNGIAHCVLSTVAFLAGSELGFGCWRLSIFFTHFAPLVGALNVFGLLFCAFLYVKGMRFPSGPDSGTSGRGMLFDYYWGCELYPRIWGVDVKKMVNCRFSMTFWQLAGISFTAASYEAHGTLDPGLVLCALSQYLYLAKFYVWEIGYMRSIDIIVDRAGFYETWGCLCWVPAVYARPPRPPLSPRVCECSPPAVYTLRTCSPRHLLWPHVYPPHLPRLVPRGRYTLHTRCAVLTPSGLAWPPAIAIFTVGLRLSHSARTCHCVCVCVCACALFSPCVCLAQVGLVGVLLNFWADDQRQRFREKKGECTVWGKQPVFIEAEYESFNADKGVIEKHHSLLLASGWWGAARHCQYLFELIAAYSWALLAGLGTHGALPLFYPIFLTILLIHRAHRDEQKCLAKYGKFYERYMELVPYKIVPFVY